MHRLWLLLLLVLCAQPLPAAAGVARAAEREHQESLVPGSGAPEHFARGESGRFQVAGIGVREQSSKPPRASWATLHPLALFGLALLPRAVAEREPDPGTFVPLSQRLPYHATAPPLR